MEGPCISHRGMCGLEHGIFTQGYCGCY